MEGFKAPEEFVHRCLLLGLFSFGFHCSVRASFLLLDKYSIILFLRSAAR
jgi:hypothetical protein